MLTNKKLFYHSSRSQLFSYLLILTTVIMLLNMVGCTACDGAKVDVSYAAKLHVTLTPSNLQGSKREAVLTLATAGTENEVARFKDFNIKLEVSAVGKDLGNSQIKFTGYDKSGKSVERIIQLNSRSLKPLDGALYDYLAGGDGGTLDYTQTEKVTFFFLPDLQSDVESMEIKITVTNNATHESSFNGVSNWQRSAYEFKVVGLDRKGAIPSNAPCTLQVTRKDAQAITSEELNNLYVAVEQDDQSSGAPHLLGVDEKTLAFQAADVQGASISKQLVVVPGTTQETVIFTFSLYQNDETEAAAIAKAKYHPVVLPYIFEVDKNQLVGPVDKTFNVVVKDPAGKVLDLAKLKKLALQVQRTDGSKSIIQGKATPDFQVAGETFTMAPDNKSATQTFTMDTHTDKKSAFKLFLVNDQGITVASEQLVSWWVGVEASVVYNPSTSQFEFTVSNQTSNKAKVTLHWENVAQGKGQSNGVKINGHETGHQDVNVTSGASHKEALVVDWSGITGGMGTVHETIFKLEAKLDDSLTIMDPYNESIHQDAPQVTIEVKDGKFNYEGNLEKAVTFVLTATNQDIHQADFKNLVLSVEAQNKIGALKTPGGRDVNGLSLDQVLDNSIQKLTKNVGQEFTLQIDTQDSREVTFTNIYLKGSHDAQDGAVPPITWEKATEDVKVTITPVGVIPSNGVLVVGSTKEFILKLENTSGFSLDQALLQAITIQAVASVNTKEPDEVVCQGIDLKTRSTLWNVLQAQPVKYQELKPHEPIQLSLQLEPGTKKLIELEVQLADNNTSNTLSKQQVRWGSLFCLVDEDQVLPLHMDHAQVDNKDKKPKLAIPVKLKNISGQPIQVEDLKNIKVVLLQTTQDLQDGNVLEHGDVTIGTIRKKGETMKKKNRVKGEEVLNLISQFESDKGKLTTDSNDLKSLLEGTALSGGNFATDGEVSLNLKIDVSKCQETDKASAAKGTSPGKRYLRCRLTGPGNTIMSEKRIEISPSAS